MPTLNWIGKDAEVDHHKQVPFLWTKWNAKLVVDDDVDSLFVQATSIIARSAL